MPGYIVRALLVLWYCASSSHLVFNTPEQYFMWPLVASNELPQYAHVLVFIPIFFEVIAVPHLA